MYGVNGSIPELLKE